MMALKLAIIIAIVFVLVKFVASFFGKGNLPLLNQIVTVILSLFVTFELFQLGQTFWEKMS